MTPLAIAGLVALGLFVVSVAAAIVRVRRMAGGVRRVREAHPGELVLATGLRRGVAVVVDRSGLSFRDAADTEVRQVPAESILSVELAPLNPRSRMRPMQIAHLGGEPIAVWAGATEDQQLEAVIAVRAALGR